MCEQSSSSNHGGSHSISDKDNRILGFWLLHQRQDIPFRNGSLSIIVGECDGVLSRFVELDVPIALGEDVYGCRGFCLGGKEILVIGEIIRVDCVVS